MLPTMSTPMLRFVKLLFISMLLMLPARAAGIVNDDYDPSYTFSTFLKYDLFRMPGMTLAIYTVGLVAERSGVDCAGWCLAATLGAVLTNFCSNIKFIHVNLSAKSIKDEWVAGTYITFAVLGLVLFAVLVLQVWHIYKEGVLARVTIENLILVALLFGPYFGSDNVHLHHWFWCFFFALIFRFEPWWSRAMQAFFWGYSLNGIAVWGIDGLIACEELRYRVTQNCPWL